MKVKYVKFSDERRKEFCIKTVIAKEDDRLVVYKSAIFDEGLEHIKSIADNAGKLKKYYNVDVCNSEYSDGKIFFDYISGKSLDDYYCDAMNKRDTKEIERLLKLHRGIILGRKDNLTVFHDSKRVNEIFGDCSRYEGKDALKCCNYDAIASNIIFDGDRTVLIDYEWVFEGNIPVNIAIYHCIYDYYEHHPEMEEVYPLKDALKYLGIKEGEIEYLSRTYLAFYDYVISDGTEEGFALMKRICLKDTKNVFSIIDEISHENLVNMCECDRLQGVIDDLNRQIFDKEFIFGLEKKDWENKAEDYERLIGQYKNIMEEHEDMIEGLQAKLYCFGSRKLLRKLRGFLDKHKKTGSDL